MRSRTSSSEVLSATSADGTPIAYRAVGEGEPVVFVHGTGTWSGDWLFVLPELKDRCTVVSLDRRGRGRSGDARDHSMDREAEDVLAVADAVGADRVVAHSYGALCTMRAAELAPGRLRRLVIYEPPIAVDAAWAESIEAAVARGEHETAVAAFFAGAGAPPDQLELIRASQAWPRLVATAPTLPRELREGVRWTPPAGIDAEALFVLGAETTGRVFLDGLDELRARVPGSRLQTIPGQHHIGHVFAAQAFARLVTEFLEL